MMQSEGIQTCLSAAPHKALGLNRLEAKLRRATHQELLRAGTARSQDPAPGAA